MDNSLNSSNAIGVFDSGLGGLTVVHAIRQYLPAEDLVFLGDIARVPYGARSSDTIRRYAQTCTNALQQHNIKMLVVACNTVSAVALDMLRQDYHYPVLGVIEPGARAAVRVASSGHIGVIATHRTVTSRGYERAIQAADSNARVAVNAAPLLVPLAEEGLIDGEITELVVQRYLAPLVANSIDALVLGCTHYPLLRKTIEEQLEKMSGRQLPVVDSAHATALELKDKLEQHGLANNKKREGELTVLVTDMPEKFTESAMRFLGESILKKNIIQVDI